ncbi:unnamed protein product, partial [Staurois parvus]
WERVPVKFGYPLPLLLRSPKAIGSRSYPPPVVFWDTWQVPEDYGAIHKAQLFLRMRSGHPAVKLQAVTAGCPQ